MNALAVLLAWSFVAPPVPDAKCPLTDNRCKGLEYARRASAATDDVERGLALYVAHRSFMSLFDETAEGRDLCKSRRYFDRGVSLRALHPEQRERFIKSRAELERREKEAGVDCSPRKPKAAEPELPPMLAVRPRQPQGSDHTPATAGSVPADIAAKTTTETPEAAAVTSAQTRERSGVSATRAPAMPSVAPPSPAPRRWTSRAWAGLGTLLGGAGLLGGMAASLQGRQAANERIAALDRQIEAENRMPTAEEGAQVARATVRWHSLTAMAAITGAAGVVAVVTGAVLLGTGLRRRSVDLAPWGAVGSAGVVLHGRF